jgi:ribonuclease HI
MEKYICYFDGACEPTNPGGNMGIGAVILLGDKVIYEHSEYIPSSKMNGKTSNNIAEYMGLLAIFGYMYRNGLNQNQIDVYGDSKLVVCQMNREWKMNKGAYIPYAQRALKALEFFPDIAFAWIPREKNGLADDLSKKGMIQNNCEFRIQKIK